MRTSSSLTVASVAVTLSLAASPVIADPNVGLGAFNSYTSPGNVKSEAGFDNANIEIVGGTVIVLGEIGGVPTLKVIEFSGYDNGNGKGTGKVVDLGNGLGPRAAIEPEGSISVLVESVPKEDCAAPNEPILYTAQESQYQIKWCKKNGSNPKWAKKNYYYQFSSGATQLVATVKYRCIEDGSLMPPGVYPGSCL